MRFCPRCQLLMDAVDQDGLQFHACRGCGGCWFEAAAIDQAVHAHPDALAELDRRYPGSGTAEAFAGLATPCPACRTVMLQQEPSGGGSRCPNCQGAWLPAGARSGTAGVVTGAPPVPAPQPQQDDLLAANQRFASGFQLGGLPRQPARKFVVVTCMDGRIPVYEMLGLSLGDAQVLRNAGGIITEDVLRSLVISHHIIGTSECLIVNHTECGMLGLRDQDLRDRLTESTGADPVTPAAFYGFDDLRENVRRQMRRVRSHPWIPNYVGVRGFVYDVKTGRLEEVE